MKYVVILVLAIVATVLMVVASHARDGWEGRPTACDMSPGPRQDMCHAWVRDVQQPDVPQSCCGEGDFIITDRYREENGQLIAIVTVDYPDTFTTDEEGNQVSVPSKYHIGTEIPIPPNKILGPDTLRLGVPPPHGGTFVRMTDGFVYCYKYPPLT